MHIKPCCCWKCIFPAGARSCEMSLWIPESFPYVHPLIKANANLVVKVIYNSNKWHLSVKISLHSIFHTQSIVCHNKVQIISILSKLQGNSEPPALEREVVLSVEDTVAKIKGPKHRWMIIMTLSLIKCDFSYISQS